MSNKIVVFDSECILCNKALDILIRLDKHKVLRYTSLQGEYVKRLQIPKGIDSLIFCENDTLYYKSTAVLKILRSLGGAWGMSSIFYVIPRFIRDFIYDMIAKYRYKIFGKTDTCYMPKKDEKRLFVD